MCVNDETSGLRDWWLAIRSTCRCDDLTFNLALRTGSAYSAAIARPGLFTRTLRRRGVAILGVRDITGETQRDRRFQRFRQTTGERGAGGNLRTASSWIAITEVVAYCTHTLDVHLFCFTQLSAVIALCDRTALPFDLEKRAVGMLALR